MFATAAAVMPIAASAADLPAPVIQQEPVVAPTVGGWYLRGDIGYKVYQHPDTSFEHGGLGDLEFSHESMRNVGMFGIGAGYKFNDHFRSDVTLDYETPSNVTGHAPCVSQCGGEDGYSTEKAKIDVWTMMLNGYFDIGTWRGLTPYVMGGIGTSYVDVSSVKSFSPSGTQSTYNGDHGTWNFAWAVGAGVSYAMTPNWTMDLGYQYRDLGKAKTFRLSDVGTGTGRIVYDDLTAHEIRLGVRYTFDNYAAVEGLPDNVHF